VTIYSINNRESKENNNTIKVVRKVENKGFRSKVDNNNKKVQKKDTEEDIAMYYGDILEINNSYDKELLTEDTWIKQKSRYGYYEDKREYRGLG